MHFADPDVKSILDPGGNHEPGECRRKSGSECGFYVRRSTQEQATIGRYKVPVTRIYISLRVHEATQPDSVAHMGKVRFLVDTGCPYTLIHRELLDEELQQAFKDTPLATLAVPVAGAWGIYDFYRAYVSIPSRNGLSPLRFGRDPLLVGIDKKGSGKKVALLGEEAIRRIKMVSSADYITLWSGT